MRWYTVDAGENGPCVFFLNRVGWLLMNPTIQVATRRSGRGTDVEFRASLKFTNPPIWDRALTGLAERFASGVCSELSQRGITVEPASLRNVWPSRRRQRIVSRLLVPLFYATLLGCVPVAVLVGLITWHGLLAVAVGGWLAVFCLLAATLRYRSAGMRGKRVFFTYVFTILVLVLLWTLITAVSL
jgi:hypothetical protein